ncbi:Hypothetical predicted protein, partial [Pelobates cultripes]
VERDSDAMEYDSYDEGGSDEELPSAEVAPSGSSAVALGQVKIPSGDRPPEVPSFLPEDFKMRGRLPSSQPEGDPGAPGIPVVPLRADALM